MGFVHSSIKNTQGFCKIGKRHLGESRLAVLVELLFNRARKQNQIGACESMDNNVSHQRYSCKYSCKHCCLFKHRLALFKKRCHRFFGMRTAQQLSKGLNLYVNGVA